MERKPVFQARPNEFDPVITDLTSPVHRSDLAAHFQSTSGPAHIICTYSDRLNHEEVSFLGVREGLIKPFEMTKLGDCSEYSKIHFCH
jgi:hypothetical protein